VLILQTDGLITWWQKFRGEGARPANIHRPWFSSSQSNESDGKQNLNEVFSNEISSVSESRRSTSSAALSEGHHQNGIGVVSSKRTTTRTPEILNATVIRVIKLFLLRNTC